MATRAARRCASAWIQCRGMAHNAAPISSSSTLDSLVPTKEGEMIRWGGKKYIGPVLGKTDRVRVEYKAKLKELRKEFQKEVEEKRIQKKRLEVADREKHLQLREQKCIIRWQRKEEIRLKTQEDREALRVILEKQRLIKAASREKQVAQHQKARDKQLDALRESSCSWIEEKDLEARIQEAMVDSIRLLGSLPTGGENYESFVTAQRGSSSKTSEDPLLRDDDDELLGAFGKRPRVSGKDILDSAVKASSRLPF